MMIVSKKLKNGMVQMRGVPTEIDYLINRPPANMPKEEIDKMKAEAARKVKWLLRHEQPPVSNAK